MVALPGLPWSPVFMSAYEAAMAGQPVPMTALPIGSSRTKSGTINEAVVRFFEHGIVHQLGQAAPDPPPAGAEQVPAGVDR